MENKHPQVFIKLYKMNLICLIRTAGVAGLSPQSFKLVRKVQEMEIQKLPMWKSMEVL